jgi:hypothetical protein
MFPSSSDTSGEWYAFKLSNSSISSKGYPREEGST